MNTLRNYSLGQSCPASPHAVVSCLPTMADVHGYEQHDPRVLEQMESGYPRFVVHIFIRRLIEFYMNREQLDGRCGVLIPGRRATQDLLDYIGLGVTATKVEESLYLVHCEQSDSVLSKRVQKFVQHTGCGISSREAEDLLKLRGVIEAIFEELSYLGNAQAYSEQTLGELLGCRRQDVLICASGMNAFYAGFRAVQEYQSNRGRKAWLQLGWLYLDSGCVLKEFLSEGETLDYCFDVRDTEGLIKRIEELSSSLACVVLECPTNPLTQVCDLARVSKAVRAAGGVMMVDPSIASIYNVDVLPYADLLVSSLTKYASYKGDVMIGALAVNPSSPCYGDLVLRCSSYYQPPYTRDLARLADQMEGAPEKVAVMDANACKLAKFLSMHPAVERVHYAGDSDYFAGLAKPKVSGGAMISIELKGSMPDFYDAIRVMKGPSFGTEFTLLSPFMYLAHYDLVTTEEGREFLEGLGIAPDLIRISVGDEPYAEVEAAFAKALSCIAN